MDQGDDSVLRTVIGAFEQNGFTIVGAQEVLPELLPRAGIISKLVPTDADVRNIKRATDVLRALEQLDVGQGCIVSNNQVLAIEAFGGTDWMLKSLNSRTEDWPYGGVLVKALKAGQDCRIDLPTVGPDTVIRAAVAGLSGIAIQAGGVILLNPKSVREPCRFAWNLCVYLRAYTLKVFIGYWRSFGGSLRSSLGWRIKAKYS